MKELTKLIADDMKPALSSQCRSCRSDNLYDVEAGEQRQPVV